MAAVMDPITGAIANKLLEAHVRHIEASRAIERIADQLGDHDACRELIKYAVLLDLAAEKAHEAACIIAEQDLPYVKDDETPPPAPHIVMERPAPAAQSPFYPAGIKPIGLPQRDAGDAMRAAANGLPAEGTDANGAATHRVDPNTGELLPPA